MSELRFQAMVKVEDTPQPLTVYRDMDTDCWEWIPSLRERVKPHYRADWEFTVRDITYDLDGDVVMDLETWRTLSKEEYAELVTNGWIQQ